MRRIFDGKVQVSSQEEVEGLRFELEALSSLLLAGGKQFHISPTPYLLYLFRPAERLLRTTSSDLPN